MATLSPSHIPARNTLNCRSSWPFPAGHTPSPPWEPTSMILQRSLSRRRQASGLQRRPIVRATLQEPPLPLSCTPAPLRRPTSYPSFPRAPCRQLRPRHDLGRANGSVPSACVQGQPLREENACHFPQRPIPLMCSLSSRSCSVSTVDQHPHG